MSKKYNFSVLAFYKDVPTVETTRKVIVMKSKTGIHNESNNMYFYLEANIKAANSTDVQEWLATLGNLKSIYTIEKVKSDSYKGLFFEKFIENSRKNEYGLLAVYMNKPKIFDNKNIKVLRSSSYKQDDNLYYFDALIEANDYNNILPWLKVIGNLVEVKGITKFDDKPVSEQKQDYEEVYIAPGFLGAPSVGSKPVVEAGQQKKHSRMSPSRFPKQKVYKPTECSKKSLEECLEPLCKIITPQGKSKKGNVLKSYCRSSRKRRE